MSLYYEINNIFPTPVYYTKIKNFTDAEVKYINSMEKTATQNVGNTTSLDSYVLKQKKLNNIKTQITKHIKQYFDKVMCIDDNVFPYITQSWINFTKEGEFHHLHAHPNSIISGVLYIDADKDNDKIIFDSRKHEMIKFNN